MKIGNIKIELKIQKKEIDKQRIAKARALSFIQGESILKINIVGFIIVYHNKRIAKIGFLKRKKVLEIN